MGKLSATAVKAATRPGRLGDGDGLFLIVQPGGSKSWMVRVQKNGNRSDFGLGSAAKVSLAKARERAREVRAWMEMGLDPLFERRKAQGIPTFREAAAKVLAAHRKTWRNEKHEQQWLNTLEAYVFPHIGNVAVSEITGPMIRNVLAEIWLSKPETARQVRQRIGTVLDWAYASGYRETEAPMRAITKALSDMTLTKLLKEMKEPYTAHGFRSAFRDWASEETDHSGAVAEAALAHAVKDKTEAAYRRCNLLEKRRTLMDDWAGTFATVGFGALQRRFRTPHGSKPTVCSGRQGQHSTARNGSSKPSLRSSS